MPRPQDQREVLGINGEKVCVECPVMGCAQNEPITRVVRPAVADPSNVSRVED